MSKIKKRRTTSSSQKLQRSLNFRKDSYEELKKKYFNKKYEDYKLVILRILKERTVDSRIRLYQFTYDIKKVLNSKYLFRNEIKYLKSILRDIYLQIDDEDEFETMLTRNIELLFQNQVQVNNCSNYNFKFY